MATYVIGDIQGCWESLHRLLARLNYSPQSDRIWLVGDLVNRGPDSLAVLRWARDQGDRLVAVLGNHDLHLLARSEGLAKARHDDTLDEVLSAPDREDLLRWLRHRPIMHREGENILLHAGLLPQWTAKKAEEHARFVECILRGDTWRQFLSSYRAPARMMTPPEPDLLLARHLTSIFTRLRICNSEGAINLGFNGKPSTIPQGLEPWFEVEPRRWTGVRVFAGHWAALGLHVAPHVVTLDTGCVWGRELTAIRLEDSGIFQEPAAENLEPRSV